METYQMYYNRQGEPITYEQRMEDWKRSEYNWDEMRRIALEEHDDVRVSTVFLGMNHQYGDGPPLLFETMIFGGEHSDDQWQYATEAEALEGHKAAVALVFKGGD